MLTWCHNCDADMHVDGGDACDYCDEEFCYNCLAGDGHGENICEDCS